MSAVRCAIYTRKSSDEGLEQDFNSLDAQREACAAYILSQASEGWELLPAHYDDGGISGGTLERPALKRLMADVAAGKIDIIVIYKIDRLTRSLLDFAKLVEALEKAGTSFVSVTQSFNTTTSMGRLTLNMLLSFAQFEREVTAERIRDKLAASKAKGMWMGGVPPLGYKPAGRSLAIIEKHAAIIRDIYERYLKLGNVRLVQQQLAGEGINTPLRKTLTGRSLGGRPFSRGNLYAILKNPIYAGDIPHREKVAPGNHKAIIARDLWNEVQQKLADQTNGGSGPKQRGRSPLAGLLRDADGEPLLASHTSKGGKRYRYYVSKSAQLGEAAGMRIPAEEIEQAVANRLAALFGDPLFLAQQAQLDMAPAKLPGMVERCNVLAAGFGKQDFKSNHSLLSQIDILENGIAIHLSVKAVSQLVDVPSLTSAPRVLTLRADLRLTKTGRAIRLVQDNGAFAAGGEPDLPLLQLVTRARRWWAILREEDITPTELARRENVTDSYVSRVLRVAFLSPRVIDAVLAGQQRADVTASLLIRRDAIPADWQKQEARFLSGRTSQRADPITA